LVFGPVACAPGLLLPRPRVWSDIPSAARFQAVDGPT